MALNRGLIKNTGMRPKAEPTPMINGYKMLKATPKITPDESPMITWGKIKGEPVYLGETSSSFRIQQTPVREEISMRMVQ